MTRISEAEYARLTSSLLQSKPTARRGVQNKWEAAFLRDVIEPAGFPWVRFEPLTLTIYDGSSDVRKARYTPDFVVLTRDGKLIAFEVKGHRTAASIVRIKAAAQLYPWISFRLATGGPGRWEVACLS